MSSPTSTDALRRCPRCRVAYTTREGLAQHQCTPGPRTDNNGYCMECGLELREGHRCEPLPPE